MELLRGAIRTYAWGRARRSPNSPGDRRRRRTRKAELWLGAHPGDPAWLETATGEVSLIDAVRTDPEGQLGAAVRARFGDVLPFLVKVLAADEPLSLQAHPSAEQAPEAICARTGPACRSTRRSGNYRDRSHKPEVLVALDDFEALAGSARRPVRWS